MARTTRKPTWLDVAIHNVGLRRAIRALDWASSWAVVREALEGREPTVEEVAEWWGMARRTAFQNQADFRAAFPTLDNPGALYATDEAREGVAAQARLGKKIGNWGEERRRRKESNAMSVAQFPATD